MKQYSDIRYYIEEIRNQKSLLSDLDHQYRKAEKNNDAKAMITIQKIRDGVLDTINDLQNQLNEAVLS